MKKIVSQLKKEMKGDWTCKECGFSGSFEEVRQHSCKKWRETLRKASEVNKELSKRIFG